MEQILLTYSLPKETIAAIMMLYRNTKVKIHSPDGDTDYFDIVAGVLQGDILAPYLFIICLDHVLRSSIDKMKDNGFKLTKERNRRYPAQTIMNACYIIAEVFRFMHLSLVRLRTFRLWCNIEAGVNAGARRCHSNVIIVRDETG